MEEDRDRAIVVQRQTGISKTDRNKESRDHVVSIARLDSNPSGVAPVKTKLENPSVGVKGELKMSQKKHRRVDETASCQKVPGTEILFDDISTQLHQLEHRAEGDTRVLLVPQPSTTDLNDPLRWSTTKKTLVLFNGCWFAFMGAITGPIMAAGLFIPATTCYSKTK